MLILKRTVEDPQAEPLHLKIDPGSRVTGFALVQAQKLLWGAELTHRGQAIRARLQSRRSVRRNRRTRKSRYRAPRFLNRTRKTCWLAPSLLHRVETTLTWVLRLCRFAPVTGIAQELVRFDMQALENPHIEGAEYQQGTLLGYEVRQYLLEKWARHCAYCGKEQVRLEIEHIHPKSQGGSDHVSNLCIACHACNQKKGDQSLEAFLKGKLELVAKLQQQARQPLKDAAAVNATRWKLWTSLKELGLPLEAGSGGRTQ